MTTSPSPVAAPRGDSLLWVRLTFLAGLIVTLALVALAAAWSLTPIILLFLVALPSPVIFLIGIFRPNFIMQRPRLRLYLWTCVALSIVSWIAEIVWLVWLVTR
jgi:hypothetical protein